MLSLDAFQAQRGLADEHAAKQPALAELGPAARVVDPAIETANFEFLVADACTAPTNVRELFAHPAYVGLQRFR